MNGDVHGGHATCGSVTRASSFRIGLVTCFATRDGIVARAAWRRQVPGGSAGHELTDCGRSVREASLLRVSGTPPSSRALGVAPAKFAYCRLPASPRQ